MHLSTDALKKVTDQGIYRASIGLNCSFVNLNKNRDFTTENYDPTIPNKFLQAGGIRVLSSSQYIPIA